MNESVTFVKNVLRTFESIYDALIGFANFFVTKLFIPINELITESDLPNWIKTILKFFTDNSLSFSIFELFFSFGILYILLINLWKFFKEIIF